MSPKCGQPSDTCGMLRIGPAGWCQRHHPDLAAQRSRQSSEAAKRSHEWKPAPEIETWAETLDFSTPEGRQRGLTEAARLVAQGGLSVGQGNAIAALARAAEGKPGNAPQAPAEPIDVQMRYGGRKGRQSVRELRLVDDATEGDGPA